MLRLLISKMAPFIIFLALIIIAIPRTIPLINRLIFFIYSIFVFWIFQNAINTERIHTTNNKKSDIVWKIILFFSVIFILMSRIILFMRFGEVPLGYDTGFFKDGVLYPPKETETILKDARDIDKADLKNVNGLTKEQFYSAKNRQKALNIPPRLL